jgi:hypothetical protein
VYSRPSDHTVRSPTFVDGESWRFHDRHEPSASFDLVPCAHFAGDDVLAGRVQGIDGILR